MFGRHQPGRSRRASVRNPAPGPPWLPHREQSDAASCCRVVHNYRIVCSFFLEEPTFVGCNQLGNLAIGSNLIEVRGARNCYQVMPMPTESFTADSLLCAVSMGGCGLLSERTCDVHDNWIGLWKDHALNCCSHVAYVDVVRCMRLMLSPRRTYDIAPSQLLLEQVRVPGKPGWLRY